MIDILKEIFPPKVGENLYVYLLRALKEGLITQDEFISHCGESDGVAVAGLISEGLLK